MADPNQYKYAAMSNLVLRADKSLMDRDRRKDDATGDPESLAGKVNLRDMGGRVARDAAPKEKMLKKKDKGDRTKGKDGDLLEEDAAALRKRKREYVPADPLLIILKKLMTCFSAVLILTMVPRQSSLPPTN